MTFPIMFYFNILISKTKFKKAMSITYDVNCILSTPFLFQRPNYKKVMPTVFPPPVLFQRNTNNFKVGQNSMKFNPFLIFSLALLKILAMPVQAQACEDSLMISQNNANGGPKFRLKVQIISDLHIFEWKCAKMFLLICIHYYRMKDTTNTLLWTHKQSSLESSNRKTLKNQHLNFWPGSRFATPTRWNVLLLRLYAFIAVSVWQDIQTNDCFSMETITLLCYCQKVQTAFAILKLTSHMPWLALSTTNPGYHVPQAAYSCESETLQLIVRINVLS